MNLDYISNKYILGCDALGGPTFFEPVAEGIDVGGVCILACPKLNNMNNIDMRKSQ